MEEEFFVFVSHLFESNSFVDLKRTSHLTKQKAENRTKYFFRTVFSSSMDEMLLLIGLFYFKKLLDTLDEKIDDKKFVCWFVLKTF
jgi:hypothetical protein